jgi:hypothetical protein
MHVCWQWWRRRRHAKESRAGQTAQRGSSIAIRQVSRTRKLTTLLFFFVRVFASTKQDEKRARKHIKLLLLGAGASGKSTVLKQMRLIHNVTFTEEEIECEFPGSGLG